MERFHSPVQKKYTAWLATLPHENSSEKQEVNTLLNRCASRQKKRGGGKKKEAKKPQQEEEEAEADEDEQEAEEKGALVWKSLP